MSYQRVLRVVAVLIVLAAGAVRAWNVSVVTSDQIYFLSTNNTLYSIENKLKIMGAIAYNPITKDIYVSDSSQNKASIFRIKYIENAYSSIVEPIVALLQEAVQALAFDYHTSNLYWTDGSGHTIGVVNVPENTIKIPLPWTKLHSFQNETPQGLAIDVCRGYLYWTNNHHDNATIERSFLNGTGREVLLRGKELHQPLAVAIDVENNRLYWSNEEEGIYYSIKSMDLNVKNGTKQKLISGTRHRPFAMAVDEQNVYWSDWINRAVWSLPKNSLKDGVVNTRLAEYDMDHTPMALMTPSGNTTKVNNTYCALHREKEIVMTKTDVIPNLIPYSALRNICGNNMNITCTVTDSGEPTCKCPESTTKIQGEVPLCSLPCENNSTCTIDSNGFTTCKCMDSSGNVCQYPTIINKLCKSHCADTAVPESKKLAICRCEKSIATENYNLSKADRSNINSDTSNHSDKLSHSDLSSHSDISQCKLRKSMFVVIFILTVLVASLGIITMILARKVRFLGRRPRIKKRIVVNKSITPLTYSRQPPEQNQQCEITIENCCNMNICETPCFEPDYRPTPSAKLATMIPSLSRSKKEDKANLLSNTDMSSEDEKPVLRR
ncbi:protein cueball [Sipha flava]|uniref:Protein cueball n=1 Tax=Sipha flava TaxID=143950 RepID=A0A2S2R809_9HEMI|nr:protein cueball [Sipha flava]